MGWCLLGEARVSLRAVTLGYITKMQSRCELEKAWNEALRTERATWERVKDNLPGTPHFDAVLWEEWRRAIGTLDAAMDALRQAPDGSRKT